MLSGTRSSADTPCRFAPSGGCARHVQFFPAIAGRWLGTLLLALVLFLGKFADALFFAFPVVFLGLAFCGLLLGLFFRLALGLFLLGLPLLFLGNLTGGLFGLPAFLFLSL